MSALRAQVSPRFRFKWTARRHQRLLNRWAPRDCYKITKFGAFRWYVYTALSHTGMQAALSADAARCETGEQGRGGFGARSSRGDSDTPPTSAPAPDLGGNAGPGGCVPYETYLSVVGERDRLREDVGNLERLLQRAYERR